MRRDLFESMGCVIAVGGAKEDTLSEIEAVFGRYERVFSRFRPESELNAVNAAAGRAVRVSALFAKALATALDGAEETEGLVDPTLGAALEAAGYDRDFAALRSDPSPAGPAARGAWRSVRAQGGFLRIPPGIQLDLNGVVKALAVDEAVALLPGGFVSAGGDLAVRGELTVELPGGSSVRLIRGGLATSGSARRTWNRGGRTMHHLIDPRTGRPADSPWQQVTVCGGSCLAADIAAKAAFLAGADGPAWLDARGLPGRFLASGGLVHVNETWRSSLAGSPLRCT